MKIFTLIISLIVLACSSKPYVIKTPIESISGEETKIYLLNHGWHTGIVIPADDIQQKLPELKDRYGTAAYIEFGWGDEEYYQAKEITSGLTLKALFWPTSAVVHTAAKNDSFYTYFPAGNILAIDLNRNGYASILQYISNSFYKDKQDKIIELNPGIYGNSQFYKGIGVYYLINTCNRWTAKALKSGGMDLKPIFNLTANRTMKSARKYANSQQ
jgi:uncharacterized protein (TIGR02117 family)